MNSCIATRSLFNHEKYNTSFLHFFLCFCRKMATKKRKLLEDPEDINQSCSNSPSRDGIVSSKRCYLCRLQVSSHAVIDLNNKSSESLKRSLEHVFEVCFKNELVCYPCRNEFESSISQMMQFKNKHLFNSGMLSILSFHAFKTYIS